MIRTNEGQDEQNPFTPLLGKYNISNTPKHQVMFGVGCNWSNTACRGRGLTLFKFSLTEHTSQSISLEGTDQRCK